MESGEGHVTHSLDYPDLSSLDGRLNIILTLKRGLPNFGKRYDWTKEYIYDNHLNSCRNAFIDVIYSIFI